MHSRIAVPNAAVTTAPPTVRVAYFLVNYLLRMGAERKRKGTI